LLFAINHKPLAKSHMPYAICYIPLRRSRALRCTAVLLAGFLLAGFAYVPILREVASFLIVEDSLEPAAAIIVLNGGMPTREIEAARIYSAGWAPVVVIVKGAHIAHSKQLRDLGFPIEEAWKVSREVLIRQGVPLSAILILKDEPSGTFRELQAVVGALRPKDAPVILVTSAVHTRRTRLTWEYITEGRSRAIVRAPSRDSFDAIRWWQQREFARSVAHEYLGLINYYAGFPISGRGALNQSQ
jgi:uncharacterized SAM-binding protein YcdF (DUF218 family)